MKQIKKKDLKEVIRLSKKWWDDLECDYNESLYELCQARLKAFGSSVTSYNDLVMCIVRIKSKTPLKTYYKVFEALGFELV